MRRGKGARARLKFWQGSESQKQLLEKLREVWDEGAGRKVLVELTDAKGAVRESRVKERQNQSPRQTQEQASVVKSIGSQRS